MEMFSLKTVPHTLFTASKVHNNVINSTTQNCNGYNWDRSYRSKNEIQLEVPLPQSVDRRMPFTVEYFTSAKEIMFLPVSVCLFVFLLIGLFKNYWPNLYEILRNGWT